MADEVDSDAMSRAGPAAPRPAGEPGWTTGRRGIGAGGSGPALITLARSGQPGRRPHLGPAQSAAGRNRSWTSPPGCVLSLGGLVLLMPHRIGLPRAGHRASPRLVAGVGGTAAGIAVETATACCTYAYVVDRGFPFIWLQRGGVADDPDVARRLAATDCVACRRVRAGLEHLSSGRKSASLRVALVVLVRRARGRR